MDSAQSIEFQRADTVATNISRSGRLITQTRNTVKPWTFKVMPMEYMNWELYRDEIEQLFIKDRHTEHIIKLGGNSGSAWLSEYRGSLDKLLGPALLGVALKSATGNTMTISVDSSIAQNTLLFKSGDILQPGGTGTDNKTYRYPYVSVYDVYAPTPNPQGGTTDVTITLNRGFIHQANYGIKTQVDGQNVWTFSEGTNSIVAGNDCTWRVLVTTLPSVVLLPGKIAQFSGEVNLMEVVL